MPTISHGLAIFDLDFTLLEGDIEAMWAKFLFDQGLVGEDFLQRMRAYYVDYDQGHLDIYDYEAYLLRPLIKLSMSELQHLQGEFLKRVRMALRPKMLRQMDRHRAGGHTLLLITAANDFLADPVAELLGFDHRICTNIKRSAGQITTELEGIPSIGAGKAARLRQWLSETGHNLTESWGYGDSHNDIPLLSLLKHPVAVKPDPILEAHARQHGWKIITL